MVPSSLTRFEISSISLIDLILNVIVDAGLLKRSLSEAIFWTLTRLNLFSSLEMLFIKVTIKELPSIKISLFKPRISEKIKSSNTLVKSVNLITP